MKFLIVLCFALCISPLAQAQTQDFNSWLAQTRQAAAAQGISQSTIDAALSGLTPIQRVIELDRKQPEGKKTFAQYKEMIVNDIRVRKGREMLRRHADALQAVENRYGVPKEVIVALWGIETNYGANTGGFNVVQSLATLAWEGRRADFFTKELMNALKIIDQGHVNAASMKGSWAGALGQNQFMPSSFHAYAVDYNGDGKRDIWGTTIDVFASIANYLKSNGWKEGERWGRRVSVPAGFPSSLMSRKIKKPLSEWVAMGVKPYGQSSWPSYPPAMRAAIVAPDGPNGEVYIVYNNYDTIMHWNRSTYFATSVGLLSDRLKY